MIEVIKLFSIKSSLSPTILASVTVEDLKPPMSVFVSFLLFNSNYLISSFTIYDSDPSTSY